jgi:replicative DNA helicase
VLVLSQLGRALEKRRNKRPTLRDFRERTIAKHADMVIFLYRDEVYDPDSEDRDSMEMLIQKNRHGPLGMAHLSFNNQILRWQPFPDEGTKSMARCREMLSIEYAVKS